MDMLRKQYLNNETPEQVKKRVERMRKILAKYGIHTEEELDAALKELGSINIGCLTTPAKQIINAPA